MALDRGRSTTRAAPAAVAIGPDRVILTTASALDSTSLAVPAIGTARIGGLFGLHIC